MERLAYKKLLGWKNNKNRKPLILNGARQVGKTWFSMAAYKEQDWMVNVPLYLIEEWIEHAE